MEKIDILLKFQIFVLIEKTKRSKFLSKSRKKSLNLITLTPKSSFISVHIGYSRTVVADHDRI